ncbi:MAG: hypothetical protein ACPGU5_04130 [Lishizhenia sp.]
MKKQTLFWIILTSLLLLLNAIASQLGIPYSWLLSLTAIGSIFIIVMVYNVLKEEYQSKQSFDDWFKENIEKPNEIKQ